MPEYLSANMICSEKGKVFSEQASQTRLFLWTNIHIFLCQMEAFMYLCNQLLGVELMSNQIHEAKLKQITLQPL